MLRILALGSGLLLASATEPLSQMLRINCQTQGPQILFGQISKAELESGMDHNGCRYSYTTGGGTLEKAVIMRAPASGELTQVGEFSFFYRPKVGFKGKDSFTVYLCGTGKFGGTGCARLNYNVTVH